jgi:hypothetical protein
MHDDAARVRRQEALALVELKEPGVDPESSGANKLLEIRALSTIKICSAWLADDTESGSNHRRRQFRLTH